MTFKLFTPLFDSIDQLSQRFITDLSSRMVTELTPIISVGLTFSFILYSLLIIQGLVETPILQFLTRALRLVIIMAVASAGGFYQSHLASLICSLPDAAAQLLINPADPGSGAACLIDQAGNRGFQCASDAFDKAGLFVEHGIVYGTMGTIITISTMALLSMGGAYILMSKIILALLAGLGPLFIMLLAFEVTQRLFSLWLGQVCHYILLLVLYAAVFGLVMNMFCQYMDDMKLDGCQNVGHSLGGAAALATTMTLIVRQLPKLAGVLAGEISLNYVGMTHRLKTGIQSRAKKTEKRLGRLATRHPGLTPFTAPVQQVLSHRYFQGSKS